MNEDECYSIEPISPFGITLQEIKEYEKLLSLQ